MTILDAPLRSVSDTVVGLFGKSITLKHRTVGVADTETGGVVGDSESNETVRAAIGRYRKSEIGGTIEVGDIPVLIAALGLASAPEVHDELVVDSVTFRAVAVDPIFSGDQVAAYRVQARR